jgi:hypothetical protein
MNVFEFGDAKLRLKDIDPLYTALWKARLPLSVRQRFTFAEVTFDLAGVAARITEAKDYWTAFEAAARATPRGAPRRYFRGHVALEAVAEYKRKYGTVENLMTQLHGTFTEVNAYICREFAQYGPTAAFKLADMAERVCCNKIDFSETTAKELCCSKQVQKGFDKAYCALRLKPEELLPALKKHRWATLASPRYDRALNAQEFETILCYYSHDDAHQQHNPGDDIEGIRKELTGFGDLADLLIRRLP